MPKPETKPAPTRPFARLTCYAAALLALVALAGCPPPPPPADAGTDAPSPTDITLTDASDVPATDVPPGCTDAGCPDASAPFLPGPYGTRPREIAGDFTLPTTDGDWNLRAHWTGEDNFIFLVYTPGAIRYMNGTDYSVALFGGSVGELLTASPRNTHYVFLWRRGQPEFDQFRDSALIELSGLSAEDQAHWRSRLHFVTTQADMLTGWVGDLVRARLRSTDMVRRYDPFQWAIDRTQRVREVGQLGRLASGGLAPDLTFAAAESVYYNFEHQREQALAARPATVVQLLREETVVEETFPEVMLPDEATMATFDTLEVDLTTNCVNHRDGECGAWDYISDLRLCEDAPATGDAGAPDASGAEDAASGLDGGADAGPDASTADAGPPRPRCETEIARWITTYWREGRWVTDISAMLPLLRRGGRHRFRWYASRQWDPRPANYIASLSLRFANRGRGMRPVEVRPVYQGGAFNAAYNAAHPPVRFTVPEGVRRVELYALVTGHGSETLQCAEFCNHTHHFAVNGTNHELAFPEAQTLDGCRERVDRGVVPNQHGTWYFGRGGWCPGADVPAFVADVTPNLRAAGAENELTYTAMVGRALPAAGRNYGNINLTAYLVYWR